MPCKCNMCTHWWVLMYCIFTSGFCSYCVWNTLFICHRDLLKILHTVQFHLYLFWYYLWWHWWCYPLTLSSSTFDNFDTRISYAFIFGVPVTCLLLGFSCWYRWIKSNANSFSLYFILQVIYGKLFSLIKFLRQVAFTSMLCTTLISVYVGQATCLCRHH